MASTPSPARTFLPAALAAVIMASCVIGLSSRETPTNAHPGKRSEAEEATAAAANCRVEMATMKARYAELTAAGQHWDAARRLGNCGEVLHDAELSRMASDAEGRYWVGIASDRKADADARINAIEKLQTHAPAEAEKFAGSLPSLKAQAARQVAAKLKKADADERAKRRKEGVTIGMTSDEVLQSSWGRPRKVNRTIYSFGVHEQWVYDGGYLYFRDGKLTTIQN